MEQQKFVYLPGLGMSYSRQQKMHRLTIRSADIKALGNPEARKLAKRIVEANQRIGAQSEELVSQINTERSKEKMMADQLRDYPPKDAYTKHLKQEALKAQSKKIEALVRDREELIDAEIDAYEFKKVVCGLLDCYDKETSQRAKDLRRHIEAAKEILETQFSQATAYEQLLLIINNKLNSPDLLQVIWDLPDDHKFVGELTVTSGIKWIIDAIDFIEDLPDCFDKL